MAERTSLQMLIYNLPIGFCVIGDAAYVPSERLSQSTMDATKTTANTTTLTSTPINSLTSTPINSAFRLKWLLA